jgi:hypothetical protein
MVRGSVWGPAGQGPPTAKRRQGGALQKSARPGYCYAHRGKLLPVSENATGVPAIRTSHVLPEPMLEHVKKLHQPHQRRASGIITPFRCGFLPGKIVAKEWNPCSRIPRMPGATSSGWSNRQLDVSVDRVPLIRVSGIRFGVRHLGAAFLPPARRRGCL